MNKEEFIDYFGECIDPNLLKLQKFNKDINFTVGEKYLYNESASYPGWITEHVGKPGWNILVCKYKRSGVAFLSLEGDDYEEVVCYKYPWNIQDYYPMILRLKDYNIHSDFKFAFRKIPYQVIE